MEELEIKNLATKMVKIMADVKRIAKNGHNAHFRYDYVTEADVMDSVREIFVKHNVFVFSGLVGTDRNNESGITSVIMEHTFVDADSGEHFKVKGYGQGQDKTGDKGGNKAITAAVKYMLLKTLFISTGDDPEATDENGKSTAPKAVKLAVGEANESLPKKYGFTKKTAVEAPTVAGADEF